MEELIFKQQTSRKTVIADIQELKTDLLEVYGDEMIRINDQNYLYLNFHKIEYTGPLLSHYFQRSQNFGVLHFHLLYPKIRNIELKNRLFCSTSQIYKVYKNLNLLFKSLNISYGSNGLKGKEQVIRHLLVELYWKFFGEGRWPFEKKQSLFFEMIDLLKSEGYVFNKYNREKITYWLAITSLRIEGGHKMKPKKHSKYSVKWSLDEFLVKCMRKAERDIYDVSEESRFLQQSLGLMLKVNLKHEKLNVEHTRIEKMLFKMWENQKLPNSLLQHFKSDLFKIQYYIEEDLMSWFHFLEPNAKKKWNCYQFLLKPEIKEILRDIDPTISSAYIYSSEQAGLLVRDPLRVQIQAEGAQVSQVAMTLIRYSSYPILFVEEGQEELVLTNILEDYQIKGEIGAVGYFFYELPLTDIQMNEFINKGLEQKNKMNTSLSN